MVNAYRFLSSKSFSVFAFTTAILLKIALRRIFFLFGSDKLGQVVVTRNFLNGHGISIDTVALSDLSQRLYIFSPDWPIGYNLLLSPLWLLTNGDFTLAIFLIDCLTAFVLIWYLRKLFIDTCFPTWLTNLLLIFQALFISQPLMYANTDFVSTALLLAAIYHLNKFLTQQGTGNHIYYSSFFLLSTGLIRYQYIPVILLLLCMVLVMSFKGDNRARLRKIVVCLLALSSFFAIFLLYQYTQTVSTFFLSKMKSGFYPDNISSLYPFIPGSFLNLNFLAVQASKAFNTSYSFWISLATWINIPLTLLLSFLLIRYIWKRSLNTKTPGDIFIVLGGFCSLLILGELLFLSVTKDKHIGPPLFEWTFVSTGRYFAWIILFIQLGTAWWIFCAPGKSFLKSVVKLFFIIAVSIQIMHGAYYVTKQLAGSLVPMNTIIFQNKNLKPVIAFIGQTAKNDPERNVVVTAFDKQYGFIANLYGAAGFFSPQALNETIPKASKKAVILIALADKERPYLAKFLKQPGVRLYHKTGDFFYFTYFVDPHGNSAR
jgi:hypothetical protein